MSTLPSQLRDGPVNGGSVVSQVIHVLEPLTTASGMWASDSLSRRVMLHVLAKKVPLQAVSIAEAFIALREGQLLVTHAEDALCGLTADWEAIMLAPFVLCLACCW
jgi:hypothetical protein